MQPEITGFFHEPTNTVSYVVADPETAACAVDRQRARLRPGRGPHRHGACRPDRRAHPRPRAHGSTGSSRPTSMPTTSRPRPTCATPSAGGSASARGSPPSSTPSPDLQRRARLRAATARSSTTCSRTARRFAIGALEAEYLATPGHTPACGSYKVGDNIFVGDTLFMPDYGTARCDFPGGDARTMYRSIRRILAYHPQTVLWMCHDYGAPGREELRLAHHGRRRARAEPAGPGRHRRGRVRGAARGAGRHPRHPEAPHPLDPGQHARRQPAAARGQRHDATSRCRST